MSSASTPSTPKRKHNVLTVKQKLEILSKLDKGESGTSLARSYNVGKATISDIKKNREGLTSFSANMDSGDGVKKRKTMKSAMNKELDNAVLKWFVQKRSTGQPISGPLLCEKALDFNEKLEGPADFKASSGWLHKFKARHGIRELQVQGEALSANSSAAEKFKVSFQKFLNEEGFSREDVYNADETGINWRSLPRKSLASREETAARGFKVSKDRVTAMTCANAAGTHKLPLLIIGKSQKPRCFKNVVTLPVTYKAHKSGWMDAKFFCDWYTNDFIKDVKKWRQAEGKTGRVLLLLDNAPSHPSTEVLNALDPNFVVKFFPPNVTPLIQPMNQDVIEKLKRGYRKQILTRLLQAEDDTKNCVISFSKALNMKHACYMLADGWESLTKDNLRNAWKKLWPLSEDPTREGEDGNPNDNENELTDFVALFESIPGFTSCDEDDAVEWLKDDENGPGYEILEDDEITSSLTNPEDDNEDSSSDKAADSNTEISHAEAFSAFETGLEWCEKQKECCPMQLLLLKRLRDLAAKKRVASIQQLKIEQFLTKKP